MKNIFKTFLILGVLFVSSCDLSEQPYGFYSEDNFFKSPDDAEAAVIYAYDALTFLEYSRTVFYLGDMPTEECGPKADEGSGNRDLNNWNTPNFPTNASLVNFFKYAYIAINRSNAILGKIPEANFSQDSKDQYLGEAYFLRAWNYFNLVRHFGKVPMHKTLVSSLAETAAPLATDLDEVYDLILGDCKKAIELLPIKQVTGRADKVAAQSLAAKAYLFIASAKEHNVPLYANMRRDVSMMYDSAAYFSNEVVNKQSTYGLSSNLLDIYDVDKPKGPEHIFLMSMDRTGTIEGDYSKISKLFIPYIAGGAIYLDNKNGTYTVSHDGWSVFQTKESFYNSFESTDLRAQLLLVSEVFDSKGASIAKYPAKIPYRFSRKYVDPKYIGDKTSTKPFLIRFTDIALVYAEAVGPTTAGYSIVNTIRARAGLGELQPGLSVTEFRRKVWQERSWELHYEGNRLHDLRRFNEVTNVVPEAAGLSPEKAAYYPLPQVELDLNQAL